MCTLNERFLFTLHFKSKTTTNQPLTTYKTVHSIQSISFLNKNWQIFKYNFHEKPDILALFPCQLKPCQLRKLSLRNLSKSQYAVIFEYIKAIVDSTSAFFDDNRKFFFIRFLSDIFSKYSAIYSSLLPNTVLFSSFILYLCSKSHCIVNTKEIGIIIKKRRQHLKVRQQELADLSGVGIKEYLPISCESTLRASVHLWKVR